MIRSWSYLTTICPIFKLTSNSISYWAKRGAFFAKYSYHWGTSCWLVEKSLMCVMMTGKHSTKELVSRLSVIRLIPHSKSTLYKVYCSKTFKVGEVILCWPPLEKIWIPSILLEALSFPRVIEKLFIKNVIEKDVSFLTVKLVLPIIFYNNYSDLF